MLCIQIHLTLFTVGKLTICKKESMNTMVWVHSKLGLADINHGGYYMWKNFQPDWMLWQEKTNLNPGKAGNFFVP